MFFSLIPLIAAIDINTGAGPSSNLALWQAATLWKLVLHSH
jgi:hypothetical protein